MPAEAIARWTLAGYAAIFISLVLWRALRCPEGWRLWLLYVIASLYSRLGCHWRASRRCPFLDERSAIVIANHRSPVDPILIWVGVTNLRPLEYLTAQEYFGIPGLQFIFGATRAIPVARDGKDTAPTRIALRRLKEGCYLGVFPEGRINTGPGLLPANTGIAWLALHSQAPVYPVFVHNAPQGKSMVRSVFAFSRVRMTYGDPIDLSAYYGRRITSELVQEVTDLLMRRLAELGGIPPSNQPASSEDDERAKIFRMPQAAG